MGTFWKYFFGWTILKGSNANLCLSAWKIAHWSTNISSTNSYTDISRSVILSFYASLCNLFFWQTFPSLSLILNNFGTADGNNYRQNRWFHFVSIKLVITKKSTSYLLPYFPKGVGLLEKDIRCVASIVNNLESPWITSQLTHGPKFCSLSFKYFIF